MIRLGSHSLLCALALVVSAAAPARAQLYMTQDQLAMSIADRSPVTLACLDTVRTDRRWKPFPVHVNVLLDDSLQAGYFPAASAVANTIARLASEAYGGADSTTTAEPALTWRATLRGVTVTAFRDGRVIWLQDSLGLRDETPLGRERRAGAELIVESLDALASARSLPPWPGSLTGDSVRFRLSLGSAVDSSARRDIAVRSIHSARAPFSLRLPNGTSPRKRGQAADIEYPLANRVRGFAGNFFSEYVVGADGFVERDSFRSLGDDAVSRMSPSDQEAFRAFFDAARRGVLSSWFEPARYAGCPVRMFVQQRFEFNQR
jgi:hypothetical protein